MVIGTRDEIVEQGRTVAGEAYSFSKNLDTVRGVLLHLEIQKAITGVLIGSHRLIWATCDEQPNAYEAVFELLAA